MKTRFLLIMILFVMMGCHPWFKTGRPAPEDQQPVLTSPEQEKGTE